MISLPDRNRALAVMTTSPNPSRKILNDPFALGIYAVTSICGLLDAASYLGLGHVFVELMTGNMLYLAFIIGSIGTSHRVTSASMVSMAGAYALSIAVFACGAVIGGRFVLREQRGRQLGFFAEWLCILAALLVTWTAHPGNAGETRFVVFSILALAMGIQNALMRRWGLPNLATNVMTLTFTALLSESPLGGGHAPQWARRSASIGIFILSAGIGALLVRFGVLWPELTAFVVFTVSLPLLLRGPGRGAGSAARS